MFSRLDRSDFLDSILICIAHIRRSLTDIRDFLDPSRNTPGIRHLTSNF